MSEEPAEYPDDLIPHFSQEHIDYAMWWVKRWRLARKYSPPRYDLLPPVDAGQAMEIRMWLWGTEHVADGIEVFRCLRRLYFDPPVQKYPI